MTITIGYSPIYLNWTGSHASPQRAAIALAHLQARADDGHFKMEVISPSTSKVNLDADRKRLKAVHDPDYIDALYSGTYPEHAGEQGFVAAMMFAGTRALVQRIDDTARTDGTLTPGVYFNPQGAKHHAAYDHTSGFCAINDMAWAAHHFTEQGLRVAYLDWDAHHGDGVEALTLENKSVLTASIHQWGIFPGTGRRSRPGKFAFNYPLYAGDGDAELLESVEDALELIADFEPDILLMAIGADGHESDPLAGLKFTVDGFTKAAGLVGAFLNERGIPVLIGGAGGYQPFTYVPLVWAEVVTAIEDAQHPAWTMKDLADATDLTEPDVLQEVMEERARRGASKHRAWDETDRTSSTYSVGDEGVPDYTPKRRTKKSDTPAWEHTGKTKKGRR